MGTPVTSVLIFYTIGALEWSRTTTSNWTQALNLLRIPFRHEGKLLRSRLQWITDTILSETAQLVNPLFGEFHPSFEDEPDSYLCNN